MLKGSSMSLLIADRVMETSLTVGTGPYTLSGAVMGYRAVSSVASAQDTFYYFVEHLNVSGASSGAWEVGLGTFNADGTVSRTAVHASSNVNLAVSWAAGSLRVGIGLTATQMVNSLVSIINAATRLIQTQRIMAQLVLTGQLR